MLVLLIATIFPPVIVALLNRGIFGDDTKAYSPKTQHTGGSDGFPGWTKSFEYTPFAGATKETTDATFYHAFDILIVINIASCNIHNLTLIHTTYEILKHGAGNPNKFRFNVLPGLHFTNPYGTEGNPKNAENAVTLTGGQFTSKATITIKDYDFTQLDLNNQNLEIKITSGTIRNSTNDLKISTNLNQNDVLLLEASGNITKPSSANNAPVKLEGTIVVTSNGQAIGNQLNIGGGPGGTGVSGSLSGLANQDGPPKYISITGGGNSTLTIDQNAYDALKKTATTDTLKIGSSESIDRDPDSATAPGLNKDKSFKKYWHLLPPNNI